MACKDFTSLYSLREKLDAVRRITRPSAIRAICQARMVKGHRQYLGQPDPDPSKEAQLEAADIINYAALALVQGKWNWRWWLICKLAMLIDRLIP